MPNEVIIPPYYQARGVTSSHWVSWRWQLTHCITSGTELARLVPLPSDQAQAIDAVSTTRYGNRADQMRLTPYLISLIDWTNPNDPIALQHLPSLQESASDNFLFNEVWEKSADFLDGTNRLLQQKYPDICVLRLSNTCHSFCRFCFEKERTLRHDVPTNAGPQEFKAAVEKISAAPLIRQILVSGGDPLIMPDEILVARISALAAIPQITTIRINTRSFLHNPFRLTPELATALATIQTHSWQTKARGVEIQIGSHFNHPNELGPDAITAIHTLQQAGLHVYNQTVLLKGINDDATILRTLFHRLRTENVRLHYLSVAMSVPRTGHFRTSVRRAQEVMRGLKKFAEFRGQLPHLELSHHTGKQLVPDTMTDYFYETTAEKAGQRYPIIKFLSDVTGKWEEFPDGE